LTFSTLLTNFSTEVNEIHTSLCSGRPIDRLKLVSASDVTPTELKVWLCETEVSEPRAPWADDVTTATNKTNQKSRWRHNSDKQN